MEEKYLRFYLSFHKAFQDKESNHCLRTLSDGGVEQNRELKKILYEHF